MFNKAAGQHLCLIKLQVSGTGERLWHRCFPVNFAEQIRTPFSENTSGGGFCRVKLFKKFNVLLAKALLTIK